MIGLKANVEEELLVKGVEYAIGVNDGTIFNRVIYKGTKSFNGKPMMCFETERKSQLSINPSYHSFTLEEDSQFPMPEDLGETTITNKENTKNG
tara:strand:- start:15596 stop:15877 length:282 start_codon:yes stop_codon:yes gene_type:complete